VVEGNTLTVNGQYIPSVGPWAFQGAKPGETVSCSTAEDGYYLARFRALERPRANARDVLAIHGQSVALDHGAPDDRKSEVHAPQNRNFAG